MKVKSGIIGLAITIGLNIGVSAQNEKFIGEKKIYYGASYYPEIWPESDIDKDIARMKELNMNVMRIAEFSWSTLEPEEGKYNFKWLHNVIDKLWANGISVIIGTPTATPPAWLLEKYPDMLSVDAIGVKAKHGIRRDCAYGNSNYRRESQRITSVMAKEFGKKPGLIGWQTDNEFNVLPDYSAETKAQWHQWLKKRYGTIDNLNKQWFAGLWSQTYSNFEQVIMPDLKNWYHPSLKYNYIKFLNEQIYDYQEIQIQAIREHSKAPITHDGMPGQSVDYEELFKNVDYTAVNNYHSFEAYDLIMSNYDRMRGFGKGTHWLFETAPNFSGGGNNGSCWFLHQPEKSARAAIWMNHALGAQGTMFWLWRQHPAGQEVTHGAVVSYWNKPSANYNDLKALGAELKKHSDFLMNTPVAKAEVGVIFSNKAKYGLEIEKFANDLTYYQDWTYRFYLPVANMAYLHRDVIYPNKNYDGYKLIYAPLLPEINTLDRVRLKKWVENGGTLVLGPLSGYKTENFAGFTDAYLGDISAWAGIEVESWVPIGVTPRAAEIPINVVFDPALGLTKSRAYLVGQSLSSKTGKVLGTYDYGMHRGLPAIIENKVGKGKVVVIGTDPGKEFIAKAMLNYAKELGIQPVIEGEPGVVAVPRIGNKSNATILVNINNAAKEVKLSKEGTDLIDGKKVSNTIKLEPYQVAIIKH